ncbi:MAG: phosphoglucosamine mutase [Elusimicrobia bacterium]|nr:phosphoglucosamine mutase [Elusimicrobiota bacterium]
MGRLFGTDGIRGVANRDPMTSQTALKIGQALAYILRKKNHRPRIILGKDTRLSGYMLETALATGICSMGADVVLVGPMPTPGIAFITNNMDADAGVVISASHNPYEDNGIKIFANSGYKLNNEQEAKIEELVFSGRLTELLPPSRDIGKAYREEDALGRYIVFLRHTFPKRVNLEGMKIAVDCANGATYKVAPTLFKEMRAEVIGLNMNPDGTNINRDSGSLHPELLAKTVLSRKADIGVAFDGDGDRLIAVDEKGGIVTGDRIIAICAGYLKEKSKLKNNLVVTTVMSNVGLIEALKKLDIDRVETTVGDRFVLEKMKEVDAYLGGEDSGHIIFRKHHTTGDGIITALQLMAVMQGTGKPLSELSEIMKTYPQILENIEVSERKDIEKLPKLRDAIKQAESALGSSGRVLVRYSGTQLLLRIMVEGPSEKEVKNHIRQIAKAARESLS